MKNFHRLLIKKFTLTVEAKRSSHFSSHGSGDISFIVACCLEQLETVCHIGAFEVTDRRKIPERDILLETRKGVALSYAPTQIAM